MKGTHLAGFRRALTRTLKKYADDLGIPAERKSRDYRDDFREGLTAVVSVKVMEPQFEGQTKTKLGNSEVSGAVDKIVGEMLTNFLEENPNEAKQIVQKVVLAAKARQAAKKPVKWFRENLRWEVPDFRENYLTVLQRSGRI
jgi:DNA gyrase subunit B